MALAPFSLAYPKCECHWRIGFGQTELCRCLNLELGQRALPFVTWPDTDCFANYVFKHEVALAGAQVLFVGHANLDRTCSAHRRVEIVAHPLKACHCYLLRLRWHAFGKCFFGHGRFAKEKPHDRGYL